MPEMRAELRQADGAAVDAVYIIKSELGCQQGDPLSPLYFAVALTNALHPLPDTAGDELAAPLDSSVSVTPCDRATRATLMT